MGMRLAIMMQTALINGVIMKKNGNFILAVTIIGALVILPIFSIALASGLSAKEHKKSSTNVSAQYILSSSQEAQTDVFFVDIKKVTKNDKKDYAFKYDNTAETMLIVDLSIRNRTSVTQTLAPSAQLYIRTQDGLFVSMHPSMYITEPLQFEEVAPGNTMSGQVSFNIPKDMQRPLLYIDLGWGGHVPVVYDILH